MDLLVPLEEVRACDARGLGAKAASLGELMAAGFMVPSGFVVTADAYRSGRGEVVTAHLLSLVATAYTRLGRRVGDRDPRVAVRSSVVGEDGRGPSFAGVYTSVTNVRGVTGIGDAIARCWASMNGERAIAYRAIRGVAEPPVMAVIVQVMVPARCGGVVFSVDPSGRDPNVAVVEASFGHTEAMVSGLVEPDTYVVARASGHVLHVRLGAKAMEIVPARQGETTVSVAPARRRTRALDASQVAEIARMALAVERQMGTAQDIEWCYDVHGTLFVLQARPVPAPERQRGSSTRTDAVMAMGAGARPGVATGRARVLATAEQAHELGAGDVLVVRSPSPEWLPVLDRAVAVVTDRGGMTSHLAVACHELGVPCVVGTRTATITLRTGDLVAVDGTGGMVRSARSDAAVSGGRR